MGVGLVVGTEAVSILFVALHFRLGQEADPFDLGVELNVVLIQSMCKCSQNQMLESSQTCISIAHCSTVDVNTILTYSLLHASRETAWGLLPLKWVVSTSSVSNKPVVPNLISTQSWCPSVRERRVCHPSRVLTPAVGRMMLEGLP